MTIDELWEKIQELGSDMEVMREDVDLVKQILVDVYDAETQALSVTSIQPPEE
jgi:hypothetical protein